MIDEDALEIARKRLEDFLIEMRDSRMFVMNNNGFTIKEQDGSPSDVIRMGTGMGLSMGIETYLAHAPNSLREALVSLRDEADNLGRAASNPSNTYQWVARELTAILERT